MAIYPVDSATQLLNMTAIRQVVSYKRLKTMKNVKTLKTPYSRPKRSDLYTLS